MGWTAELAGLRDGRLPHLSLQRELHMRSALVRADEVVLFHLRSIVNKLWLFGVNPENSLFFFFERAAALNLYRDT